MRDTVSDGTILVVDDEPVTLKMTCIRLEKNGFDVIACSDPNDTEKMAEERQPDAILSDINMSIKGEKLVELLRNNEKIRSIPVIFHSGESLEVIQRKAMSIGAVGGIPKTDSTTTFMAQFRRLYSRATRGK
jgi:CheY-like chemotaxis protein